MTATSYRRCLRDVAAIKETLAFIEYKLPSAAASPPRVAAPAATTATTATTDANDDAKANAKVDAKVDAKADAKADGDGAEEADADGEQVLELALPRSALRRVPRFVCRLATLRSLALPHNALANLPALALPQLASLDVRGASSFWSFFFFFFFFFVSV